jgi:hypothetical protein
MMKDIRALFRLRGTEKEIERVKARIASLSACEECVSLYMGEEEFYIVEKEEKQNGRKKRKTSI